MMVLGSTSGWAQTRQITARVYNHADVPKAVLISAKEEAEFVLTTASVGVRWVDCGHPGTCDEEAGEDEFQILIREHAPLGISAARGAETMGQSLLTRDESGFLALVYYTQVCRLSRRETAISAGEILGYVIAHEIGHLLFGPQHQDGTVMKAKWDRFDMEKMRRRELRFSSSQRLAKYRKDSNAVPLISAALR